MKLLIWSSFLILTLLWTGMAVVAVSISNWAMGLLGNGTALSDQVAELNVPAWVSLWVPPELLAAIQGTVTGTLTMVGPWLPSPDALGSLMSVLVWVTWGVGALLLLALAVGAHWFSSSKLEKR
jgi:hypothetical protein